MEVDDEVIFRGNVQPLFNPVAGENVDRFFVTEMESEEEEKPEEKKDDVMLEIKVHEEWERLFYSFKNRKSTYRDLRASAIIFFFSKKSGALPLAFVVHAFIMAKKTYGVRSIANFLSALFSYGEMAYFFLGPLKNENRFVERSFSEDLNIIRMLDEKMIFTSVREDALFQRALTLAKTFNEGVSMPMAMTTFTDGCDALRGAITGPGVTVMGRRKVWEALEFIVRDLNNIESTGVISASTMINLRVSATDDFMLNPAFASIAIPGKREGKRWQAVQLKDGKTGYCLQRDFHPDEVTVIKDLAKRGVGAPIYKMESDTVLDMFVVASSAVGYHAFKNSIKDYAKLRAAVMRNAVLSMTEITHVLADHGYFWRHDQNPNQFGIHPITGAIVLLDFELGGIIPKFERPAAKDTYDLAWMTRMEMMSKMGTNSDLRQTPRAWANFCSMFAVKLYDYIFDPNRSDEV